MKTVQKDCIQDSCCRREKLNWFQRQKAGKLGWANGKVLEDIVWEAVSVVWPSVFANYLLSRLGFCPPTEIGIKKGSLLDFKLMPTASLYASSTNHPLGTVCQALAQEPCIFFSCSHPVSQRMYQTCLFKESSRQWEFEDQTLCCYRGGLVKEQAL